MLERSSSKYDSFLFWRQPIPALDAAALEDLGLSAPAPANHSKREDQEEEGELSQFSAFSFWRTPIADVDALLADLDLLP